MFTMNGIGNGEFANWDVLAYSHRNVGEECNLPSDINVVKDSYVGPAKEEGGQISDVYAAEFIERYREPLSRIEENVRMTQDYSFLRMAMDIASRLVREIEALQDEDLRHRMLSQATEYFVRRRDTNRGRNPQLADRYEAVLRYFREAANRVP